MKRGRSKLTEAQNQLEEAMWWLGGLTWDCDEVFLRVEQVLRRHPEEMDRLVPALERLGQIQWAIERAQVAHSVMWKRDFMSTREEGVT